MPDEAPQPSEAGAERQAPQRGGGVTESARRLADRWNARLEEAAPAQPEADTEAAPVEAPEDTGGMEAVAEQEQEAAEDQGEYTQELPEKLSIDDLARDYGLEKNDIMQRVKHRVKVGDEEREVGLHELVMGYQRGREHETAMAEVERRRQSFDAERTQKEAALAEAAQAMQAQAGIVDAMLSQEEQDVHARYQHTDWQRLRGENPGEYSARWTEYQSAIQGVANRRAQAQQQLTQAHQQMAGYQQQQFKERREAYRKQLRSVIPEWADDEVAQREAAEVESFAVNVLGLEAERLAQVIDPRETRTLRLAWLGYKALENAEQVRKAPAGQVVKPAQQPTPQAARFRKRRQQTAQAEQRLKETGRQEDATRVLSERWRNRNNGRTG